MVPTIVLVQDPCPFGIPEIQTVAHMELLAKILSTLGFTTSGFRRARNLKERIPFAGSMLAWQGVSPQ